MNRENKSAATEDGKPKRKRRKTKWDQTAKLSNSREAPPPQLKQTKPDQSPKRHPRSPVKEISRHRKTRFDQSTKVDSRGPEKKTPESRKTNPAKALSRSPMKDQDKHTSSERQQSRNERERNRDRRRDRDGDRKQDSDRDRKHDSDRDRHVQRDRRSRDRDRRSRERDRDRDRRGRLHRERDFNRREATLRDDSKRRGSNPVAFASRSPSGNSQPSILAK